MMGELLDELMGKGRNRPLKHKRPFGSPSPSSLGGRGGEGGERGRGFPRRDSPRWADAKWCQYALVLGFCPHALFHNTRSDLGPHVLGSREDLRVPGRRGDGMGRGKVGSRRRRDVSAGVKTCVVPGDAVRAEYRRAVEADALEAESRGGYPRRRCLLLLRRLVGDMDARISRIQAERAGEARKQREVEGLRDARRRAREAATRAGQPDGGSFLLSVPLPERDADAEFRRLRARSVEAGEAHGDWDAAWDLRREADGVAAACLERVAREADTAAEEAAKDLKGEQQDLEVDPVCGIVIQAGDGAERRMAHYQGKQYQGWKRIREALAQLEAEECL